MKLMLDVFLLLLIALGLRASSILKHANRISSEEIRQLLGDKDSSSVWRTGRLSKLLTVVVLVASFCLFLVREQVPHGKFLVFLVLMVASVIGWFVEDRKLKHLQEYKLSGDNRIVIERLHLIIQLTTLLAILLFLGH